MSKQKSKNKVIQNVESVEVSHFQRPQNRKGSKSIRLLPIANSTLSFPEPILPPGVSKTEYN